MALYFEAPRFGDVAAEYFAQGNLFASTGPKENETAFDTFIQSAADVLAERADSERFDAGLLRRFQGFGVKSIRTQISELEIPGHVEPSPCRLTHDFPLRAESLYRKTPSPRRCRIAGRLDMVQASTLGFSLLLKSNEHARGVWLGNDFETLRELANTEVVVSGMAVFRPSGALLRVDADLILPQAEGDQLFATIPMARPERLDLQSLVREQRRKGGIAQMWRQIPAEESDEDFMAAVKEMD